MAAKKLKKPQKIEPCSCKPGPTSLRPAFGSLRFSTARDGRDAGGSESELLRPSHLSRCFETPGISVQCLEEKAPHPPTPPAKRRDAASTRSAPPPHRTAERSGASALASTPQDSASKSPQTPGISFRRQKNHAPLDPPPRLPVKQWPHDIRRGQDSDPALPRLREVPRRKTRKALLPALPLLEPQARCAIPRQFEVGLSNRDSGNQEGTNVCP